MNIHVPAYARGTDELWTPRLIKDALVDAIIVERALPARHGPGGLAAWWPGFALDYPREEQNKVRRRPSAADITHSDRFLFGIGNSKGWLNGPVMIYPEQRAALMRWAMWVSRGCRWTAPDGVVEIETEEQFCHRIGQALTTFQRKKDFAAGVIARQANEEKVIVWHVSLPTKKRKRDANYHASGG